MYGRKQVLIRKRQKAAEAYDGSILQRHAAGAYGVFNMKVFTAAKSVFWRRWRRKIDAELVKTYKTQVFSGKD